MNSSRLGFTISASISGNVWTLSVILPIYSPLSMTRGGGVCALASRLGGGGAAALVCRPRFGLGSSSAISAAKNESGTGFGVAVLFFPVAAAGAGPADTKEFIKSSAFLLSISTGLISLMIIFGGAAAANFLSAVVTADLVMFNSAAISRSDFFPSCNSATRERVASSIILISMVKLKGQMYPLIVVGLFSYFAYKIYIVCRAKQTLNNPVATHKYDDL